MGRDIRKVVILGASGAMGSGAAEVFAAAGISTVMLARTRDKAREGRTRAERLAKAEAISRHLAVGSYEEDLGREVPGADLVFEAVAEELGLTSSAPPAGPAWRRSTPRSACAAPRRRR